MFGTQSLRKKVLSSILEKVESLPRPLTKAQPLPQHQDTAEVNKIVEQIRSDGVVVLPGYSKETAKFLTSKFELGTKKEQFSATYGSIENYTRLDPEAIQFLSDEFILSIVGRYFNAQPILRMVPHIGQDFSAKDQVDLAKMPRDPKILHYNVYWHFDCVNLVNIHVLLNDVTIDDTHMVYAKKSHKKHHLNIDVKDSFYSEENIRAKYEIVHCVGPAGTVYIFDTNGLHRMDAHKNTYRSIYCQLITPGNNLIKTRRLEMDTDVLASMSDLQQNYFKPLLMSDSKNA
jgi:hypothetical protein